MLTSFKYLVLAFQLWTLSRRCGHAQIGGGEESCILMPPPYKLSAFRMMPNTIFFTCVTAEKQFPVNDWVLYRNSVAENTTDPCIAPWRNADDSYTITSACDGLYSCGVKCNMTFVLSEPLEVYAMPALTSTAPGTVSACVGDTVFLPCHVSVSALANPSESVEWVRLTMPSQGSGVVVNDYSYRLENVTMDDEDHYYALVTISSFDSLQSPNIRLDVEETPDIVSMEFDDRIITLKVSPAGTTFEYVWKVDGIVQEGENGETFFVGEEVSEESRIEASVSSSCASDEAAIFIVRDETTTTTTATVFPTTCLTSTVMAVVSPVTGTSEEQKQLQLTMGLLISLSVIFMIVLVLFITSFVLMCVLLFRGRNSAKELKKLYSEMKEAQLHSPRVITNDPGPVSSFCPVVIRQRSFHTSEVIVSFKSRESDSQPSESVNRIATVLYEVIPLIKHWDESDAHTLHTVYMFLNSIFTQVKERQCLRDETKKCILSLMKEVQHLKHNLEWCTLQRSTSDPTPANLVPPKQESVSEEGDEERSITFDGSITLRSMSAPAGGSQQQKLVQLRQLVDTVENNLRELCKEINEDERRSFLESTDKESLIKVDVTAM